MPEFVHLGVRSEYSGSAVRVRSLVDQVAGQGMTAVGLADVGNAFGAIPFFKSGVKKGVKPVLGASLRIAHGGQEGLVPLFAGDVAGYRNLCALLSETHVSKRVAGEAAPVLPSERLFAHSAGLICLSGGQAGPFGADPSAENALGDFHDVFGERLFLEVQRSVGDAAENAYIQAAVEAAIRHDVALVATHPVYFLEAGDIDGYRIRRALAEKNAVEDMTEVINPGHYLLPPEEMRERFRDIEIAADNTVAVAEMCTVPLDLSTVHLPRFPLEGGRTEDQELERMALEGLRKRIGDVPDHYAARLVHELNVIREMGFAGYFLIVGDLCWLGAQQQRPCWPRSRFGRGVAGCLRNRYYGRGPDRSRSAV